MSLNVSNIKWTVWISFLGWVAVICQREVVKLCPQFSAPSPLVWESWTWVTTNSRIQEGSWSLLDWRVHTAHWRLSGQIKNNNLWKKQYWKIFWKHSKNVNVFKVFYSDLESLHKEWNMNCGWDPQIIDILILCDLMDIFLFCCAKYIKMFVYLLK